MVNLDDAVEEDDAEGEDLGHAQEDQRTERRVEQFQASLQGAVLGHQLADGSDLVRKIQAVLSV